MLKRYWYFLFISLLVLFSLACSFSSLLGKVFGSDTGIENSVYILEEEMNSGNSPDAPESDDLKTPISFSGQISFVCDYWVGDGGDSEGMGNIPVVVNFDSGDFYGEASFSYVKENGKTSTSTFVYQGNASQEGILIGTMKMTTTVDNVDVGFVGGTLAALGIISEDGRELHLFNFQESNTERIQLYLDGRDVVVKDTGGFVDTPPNCRK